MKRDTMRWTADRLLTLNSGIVLIDEVALDELNGKRGLADTWELCQDR